MKKVSESSYLNQVFYELVEHEELLINKYCFYLDYLKHTKSKNIVIVNLIKEFEKEAQQHIKILKDKMIKLSL